MSRQHSPRIAPRHEALLPRVQALTAAHPCWGNRRFWADLRVVAQWSGNQQRGWRLRRGHHRLVPPHRQLKAKQTPTGSPPSATTTNAWWGLDLTTLLVGDFGGALA